MNDITSDSSSRFKLDLDLLAKLFRRYLETTGMDAGSGTAGQPLRVFLPDDRDELGFSDVYPWCCICALEIAYKDDVTGLGTGWLASPRTVITAGHCVYDHEYGAAQQITVIPGYCGSRETNQKPYGTYTATAFDYPREWANDGSSLVYDYGAIFLTQDCHFGEKLYRFEFGPRSDEHLRALPVVYLSGYPKEFKPSCQYQHALPLQEVNSTTLGYQIDTSAGQSGAPLWYFEGEQPFVVGIHHTGQGLNWATRITSAVDRQLKEWIERVSG